MTGPKEVVDEIIAGAEGLEDIAEQMHRGDNERNPTRAGRVNRYRMSPPTGKGSRPFAVLKRGKPKPVTLPERA